MTMGHSRAHNPPNPGRRCTSSTAVNVPTIRTSSRSQTVRNCNGRSTVSTKPTSTCPLEGTPRWPAGKSVDCSRPSHGTERSEAAQTSRGWVPDPPALLVLLRRRRLPRRGRDVAPLVRIPSRQWWLRPPIRLLVRHSNHLLSTDHAGDTGLAPAANSIAASKPAVTVP